MAYGCKRYVLSKLVIHTTQCFSFVYVKEWLEINLLIPSTNEIIIAYKLLLEGKELNKDEEGVFG